MLAFGSLAVGLLVVEIAFRLGRGTPWYDSLVEQTKQTIPYQVVGEFHAPLRASLNGGPKGDDAFRILFLGDSFTYGEGVNDAADTFVELINERLNERKPLGPAIAYESFNGGIPGSLTKDWIILFKEAVDRFEPDLVVAVFFLRDGTPNVGSIDQIDRIREGLVELKERSWLLRHWHTYRFFRERREQTLLSGRYLGELRRSYLGDDHETEEWRRAQENLLWIRDQTLQRGARFAIVIFPILFQLDADYPLTDVCETIESFCKAGRITAVSLLPAFMHKNAPSLWVSPLDQHPNERAHALAADAIGEFVQRLIVDRSHTGKPGDGR